jgi:hypothetical protein
VRWQSVEITRLVFEAPRLERWTACREDLLLCLRRADRRGAAHRAVNQTPYHTLCGRVALVRQLISPPGEDTDDPIRTTHVLVTEVRC